MLRATPSRCQGAAGALQPMRGMRVLELCSVLAGPSACQFFAELGGSVVKVEPPAGDVTRKWWASGEAPAYPGAPSSYYHACNAGKSVLPLDLRVPASKPALHDLLRAADVVVASYRPKQPGESHSVAQRLGADYASAKAANPAALYVTVSGHGAGDPRPGFDAALQAGTGWMHINGAADGPPTKVPVAVIDLFCAHQVKEAVLAALLQRAIARPTTSAAAAVEDPLHVHCDLRSAALGALANQWTLAAVGGGQPSRMGSAHPSICPYGTPFLCADGISVVFACGSDSMWCHLAGVLQSRWDLHSDSSAKDATLLRPQFATNPDRVRRRVDIHRLVARCVALMRSDEIVAAMDGVVPTTVVASLHDAAAANLADVGIFGPEADAAAGGSASPVGLRQALWACGDAEEVRRPKSIMSAPGSVVIDESVALDSAKWYVVGERTGEVLRWPVPA